MTAVTFTCACCGKEITGLPDLAFDAPLHYHGLAEVERARRARLDSDLCVIDDEDHFIRAVCPIPIIGADQYFAWGVWASLSAENFERYEATFDDGDQSELGAMFGWLSNRVPGYPDTLNLRTSVVPRDGNDRPLLWISEMHDDHPLYSEQREGISRERLGEIYASQVCEGGTA